MGRIAHKPRDAGAVVLIGRNASGTVGAMIVITADAGRGGIVIKIPAGDIVDIPVAVVINAVSGNLIRVGPQYALEILVAAVHARVNQRHNHVPASAVIDIPGLLGVHVHAADRRDGRRCLCHCALAGGAVPVPGSRGFAKGGVEHRVVILVGRQLKAAVIVQRPLVGVQRIAVGRSGIAVIGLYAGDIPVTSQYLQPRSQLRLITVGPDLGGAVLVDYQRLEIFIVRQRVSAVLRRRR
ncbi:hypothetical protein SDC9_107144 [bioreactor metagenome]|uniref:Uncharacterized protein n=1 Tax=bioreactor metagenome TaxID=1076179 RepID=A0A645BAV2_9ZZZZ